ncbi:MAG: hypothetical protein HYW70_01275 [Candidatus Nealsonbacteria bacterium]|nr:hypothetical protein [Candidatus Nealsonbacteria bacterium]
MCEVVQVKTDFIIIRGEIPVEIFRLLQNPQWEEAPPLYKNRCGTHKGKIFRRISFWGYNLSDESDEICGTQYRIIIKDIFTNWGIALRGYAPFVCFPQETEKNNKVPVFLGGFHPLSMGNNFEAQTVICEIIIEILNSASEALVEA